LSSESALITPPRTVRGPCDTGPETLVLHAVWCVDDRAESGQSGGAGVGGSAPTSVAASRAGLHLWAESESRLATGTAPAIAAAALPLGDHPFAEGSDALLDLLAARLPHGRRIGEPSNITIALPSHTEPGRNGSSTTRLVRPLPSPGLAHRTGAAEDDQPIDSELIADVEAPAAEPTIAHFRVPTLRISPVDVPELLDRLEDDAADSLDGIERTPEDRIDIALGESVRYFAAASRLVRHLLAQQRFVPMLAQDGLGNLRGVWQPWLGDAASIERLSRLLGAMPAAARAVIDNFAHDGAAITEDFILRVGDALCRLTLVRDTMADAIDGRDPKIDAHVSWLTGLLAEADAIGAMPASRGDLVKHVRRWIGNLEDRGSGAAWRLLLKLQEPIDLAGLTDFGAPGEKVAWPLVFMLQSTLNADVRVEAQDIWVLPGGVGGAANVEGLRLEAPQETLLAELGRAARLYKKLEKSLEDSEPTEMELSTSEAYQFLREIRPLLIEQGFSVEAPEWWDSPSVRLGARLQVESEEVDFSSAGFAGGGGGVAGSAVTHLGLSSLVSYRWQIAVGQTNLTLEQFQKLAAQHSPLIRLNGRWVEIRPEDVKAAMRFIQENPGGRMEVGRAIRLAYASDVADTGIAVLGMDATGWVATVFGDARSNEKLPLLESPRGFIGTLRPYQVKGLSWLAFLDRFGLGACLADDMGLGKTIQLLALLAHERASIPEGGDRPAPTLLVVPMSVVSNWVHEARRFTPDLKVMVHHGVERKTGQQLLHGALSADVVITTYALAHRDREELSAIGWSRVVLDEAQNIKNPAAKQTRAVHGFNAPRRIALTGTPLENRLTELWSIIDFLNPGYLGTGGEFRRGFALPVERYHDKHKGAQLRGLVQPFVLRRLKSDPNVITDLPEKVETKEYCYLTPEQATLYQTCVSDMLTAAERAEGIQRRGLVLAGLIKLKQICNHPAQFLKEAGEDAGAAGFGSAGARAVAAARSGKCARLIEMLQEVVAAGDKALVFTQFRQMGHILQTMLRQALDREILFLHGGTAAGQRQAIVAEFQASVPGSAPGPLITSSAPSGRGRPRAARAGGSRGGGAAAPVLLLSLKAGGVGLNLTAANHVFHFDRWWNPAVETQATDRAYRIGQTRTVQVHKFVVSGTLEERIDQMIEEKTTLAAEIIGSGEEWLTELSTTQLRDLLTLRPDAVGDDEVEGDA